MTRLVALAFLCLLSPQGIAAEMRTVAPEAVPAPGVFLVAKRALQDPNFGRSVVYLVEHDGGGSWGVIVNRESEVLLSEAVPGLDTPQAGRHNLYLGGPVELDTIVVMFRSALDDMDSVRQVSAGVYLSADLEVLRRLLANETPQEGMRLFIGHSGWAPGQLEFEIERDSWHVVPAEANMVFSPESGQLWNRLIPRLEPRGIQVQGPPGLLERVTRRPARGGTCAGGHQECDGFHKTRMHLPISKRTSRTTK